MTNLITAMTAATRALQDAFEDEDRFGEAKDALDALNRELHQEGIDPALGDLATNLLELGYGMLD